MSKSKKNKAQRFGIFYRSNNKWTGPYAGVSFTKYTLSRNPVNSEVSFIKNHVLKSCIELRPVTA
jgi:hypothetical protein